MTQGVRADSRQTGKLTRAKMRFLNHALILNPGIGSKVKPFLDMTGQVVEVQVGNSGSDVSSCACLAGTVSQLPQKVGTERRQSKSVPAFQPPGPGANR